MQGYSSVLRSLPIFYRQSYSAVTDFHFYRTIFEQPLRKTLIYFLFLSVHTAALLTLILGWHYGPQLLDMFRWAQNNLPPFEVIDGRLSVATEQPLVKKYPGKETITFVFDTTGTYSDPSELEDPVILFTEDNLYFRLAGETKTYWWKDFGTFQVGSREFGTLISFFKWAYFPVGYCLALSYTLVAKGLSAIFLTLLALSTSLRHGIRLPFQQRLTIALYGLTPAVVIDLAVKVTGVQISYFFLLYFTIAAIYTYSATQKCVISE